MNRTIVQEPSLSQFLNIERLLLFKIFHSCATEKVRWLLAPLHLFVSTRCLRWLPWFIVFGGEKVALLATGGSSIP